GAVGASGGALLGLPAVASMLLPGVGTVVALGTAGMALFGLIGAAAGALAGASLESALAAGLPKGELLFYAGKLGRGCTVVIVLAEDDDRAEAAAQILRDAGAQQLDAARRDWTVGLPGSAS